MTDNPHEPRHHETHPSVWAPMYAPSVMSYKVDLVVRVVFTICLALVGYLSGTALNELKDGVKENTTTNAKLTELIHVQDARLKIAETRLEYVQRTVDANQQSIERLRK